MKLDTFKRKKVGVIGYGSQGRAQALNLRDSGLQVMIGARPDGKSWQLAKEDKFPVNTFELVAQRSDLIMVLLPDELHGEVYNQALMNGMWPGKSLGFSHGLSIHFKTIIPPGHVDVFMVAPKGPGKRVREAYLNKEGMPAVCAVHQDSTGRAKELAMAYALAIGCPEKQLFWGSFREESLSDLFGEQAVLCGGVPELIKEAFNLLVKKGIPAELAYFECLHELKFIVDLIHREGIAALEGKISPTAHYGGMTRGPRVISRESLQELEKIFHEIESGDFVKEWLAEANAGKKKHQALAEQWQEETVEKVGAQIRQKIFKSD